jgi:hypothetical protein
MWSVHLSENTGKTKVSEFFGHFARHMILYTAGHTQGKHRGVDGTPRNLSVKSSGGRGAACMQEVCTRAVLLFIHLPKGGRGSALHLSSRQRLYDETLGHAGTRRGPMAPPAPWTSLDSIQGAPTVDMASDGSSMLA